MYTDYQAEAHFFLATGEPHRGSADAPHPAPDLVTEPVEQTPPSPPSVALEQHPAAHRPA